MIIAVMNSSYAVVKLIRLFFHYCSSSIHNCDDHTHLQSFFESLFKFMIFIHSHSFMINSLAGFNLENS